MSKLAQIKISKKLFWIYYTSPKLPISMEQVRVKIKMPYE
jgi:hypothetical protein